MPSYKLMYFNGKGRAETARMLFALKGVDYEDYRFAEGEWEKIKPTTPFGQAPVLEVDGVIIGQSHAVERLLARRFGFAGKTDLEEAQVDMIVDCVEDVAQQLLKVAHEKDEAKKEEVKKKVTEETLPQMFGYFEKFMESNKSESGYFVGDSITFADITFANAMAWIPMVGAEFDIAKYSKLKALVDKVYSEPAIAEWIKKRPDTKF